MQNLHEIGTESNVKILQKHITHVKNAEKYMTKIHKYIVNRLKKDLKMMLYNNKKMIGKAEG